MSQGEGIELRWLFMVIRRWLWLIVVCALVGGISAFLVSSWMPPVYSASATLLAYPAPGSGGSDYSAILASERLAHTYSQMLTERPVMEKVVARLGLGETPNALAKRIRAKSIPDTQLILLTVEHTDPTLAALIANSTAEVFIARIQALQAERYSDFLAGMEEQIVELSVLIEKTQASIDALETPEMSPEQTELSRQETILAGYRGTYAALQQNYGQMRLTAAQSTHSAIIAEAAHVPESSTQHRLLYTALAAVVGAMLAVGGGFLIEYLDDTIKTPDDVGQTLGLETLGTIGRLAKGEKGLVVAAQPLLPVAEAFRVLGTNVHFSGLDRPLRTLLVTSPGVAEGKSTTVANLAVAMAQAGLRVVAVDADLRRPQLGRFFGLEPRHEGLPKTLLEGNTDGLLRPTQVEGLKVLTSGEPPPNPVTLLGSPHMQELLHELAQQADVVLIDSPPVLPVADAALLAQEVDGVLLVLEAGHSRREAARQAVERLRQVGANLVGVVLNAVPVHKNSYYYHSYHEYYGNGSRRRKHRLRRWKGRPAVLRRLFGGRRRAD